MVNPALKSASAGLDLRIEAVSHAFPGKAGPLPVLQDVQLNLEPGSFVALLGPSGCGKSTLLRLVAGLEPPVQGRILADGTPITGPDPSRVVVFQDPTLYPWRTVEANVGLGPEARGTLHQDRHRIRDALQRVGLAEFADSYPHQLSGGMAQRAALARALVNDPRLLILDEPLGKLDSLTRLTMQGEIQRLWQNAGFTVLLVTHDIEEALLLSERVIVFSDRPATVLADLIVDRPYPRHRDDAQLVSLRKEILGLLGMERSW
ncbi:ABC transporter ATP-binding protein [Granulibacter bethesdensis]|uniref:Alkanesulfonates transport ATP-binding protein n=1 Tax=Granulibacter bethesdensis (strain ATCC BAA-1260 / CGDNIH1) TaxID=391165 RepID=Q0BSN6_GRABC|nr:ABC transporter ATP-binding protein [Granulibacter bethesdensis]ABI62166.1 Alkanesulfonates transport ATP-binding protein [Granulibacter bethesdensis CGDNIH1]AHJ66294.1 Alkanesulfonates transport ATP-binding protein [Granulibacter bethesdensis CGDNIH4]APH51993.1 Alkanesulfonates transport ATP-binding protein [Granulibacter bethesdensis]APH59598.1 Alkanesulfonates transport ATP-binding protein [Granulibacter bethesdensis]APH64683.1 Alkanesulfonates transport ATP-binding protein [Granulibacte